jgi:D-serine deaminase-like pyridoxal phosphate-dependent protein
MKPRPDLPQALAASVGLRVDRIDTPALVVDLDAMERNIARMADFARKHQVLWRPHAKLHKSAEIALQLQRAGAVGACVQKTAEAEALAAGGVRDITITNQVIAHPKLLRVARLAARLQAQGGRLALAVDSAEGIQRLAEAMAQAAPQRASTCWSRSTWARALRRAAGRAGAGAGPGRGAAHPAALCRLARLPRPGPAPAQRGRAARGHRSLLCRRRATRATSSPATGAAGAIGDRRRHRHAGARGRQRRLWRAAGGFVPVHGHRLTPATSVNRHNPRVEHALYVKTQVVSVRDTHAVCDAGHKSHAIDSGLPTVAPAARRPHPALRQRW